MNKKIDTVQNSKNNINISRRDFLIGSSVFAVAIGTSGAFFLNSAEADGHGKLDKNPWLTISPEGIVEIIFPSTDMGQGSTTALPVILAEELDVNWGDVIVKQLNEDDRTYGNPLFGGVLYTAGSTAIAGYYDPMRRAGAQVKALLIDVAAQHWNTSASLLEASESVVTDKATGNKLSYGEIVSLKKHSDIAMIEADKVKLKTKSEFKLIGKDVPRRDIPSKAIGSYEFGIDVRIPEMVYAVVERAPVEGETPASVDDVEALAQDKVIQVVALPDGVAVVAETLEAAFAGRAMLNVTWTENSPARKFNSKLDLDRYVAAFDDENIEASIWSEAGNPDQALDKATKTISAIYKSEYASHAQFEPMSAVASVTEGGKKAEAWIGSQSQTLSHYTIREVLGIENEDITIHMMPMGGSFGRRTELVQPYLRDALLASKAVGRPVKVIWTREDDVQFGSFRPLAAQKLEAGLDDQGRISGWKHSVSAPSVIQYFNPVRWAQVAPKDIISVKGSESEFYELPDKRAEHLIMERGARLAPWRGIGGAYTSFAAEAFMDEMAEAAGQDPVTFRMQILKDNPRGQEILKRVVKMADFDKKRDNTSLGLSFAGYGKSMAAGIAEISLDQDSGEITVINFWASCDAGLVISPNNTLAQIEGGIIFGIGSSLKEEITITDGMVDQSNYYDYSIASINDAPEIYIDVVDVDAPPTQVGELGTPMVAGAIANAFHAMTGKRLRHMPFTPERVLEALNT